MAGLSSWNNWRHRIRIASQMRAARPYSDSKPYHVTDVYWIYAVRKKEPYPSPTPRSGKWLAFGNPEEIDLLWAKIKTATEQGKLGGYSKVATARMNFGAPSANRRVICVFTYDSEDLRDVMRVRQALRELGVTEKTGYKTDEKTMAGAYVNRGCSPEDVWKYQD